MAEETVDIEGVWVRETDNATLLSVDDVEVWIPKSQVRDCSAAYPEEGDLVTLEVTEWIATEKELI